MLIPDNVASACEQEARRLFPLETGGVLMGEIADNESLSVRSMIGPGPGAEHARDSFKPDAAWQWREIAQVFTSSAGSVTYIGDWHTHPRVAGATLSKLDLKAIFEILSDPRSGTRKIATVVLSGGRSFWKWHAWAATLTGSNEDRDRVVVRRADLIM